ncbi:MAG: DUF5050 domain-containing protein [Oscillospiraceae bacterium]|nr:DUF5050 domain-containing protein [Oscillospiraceae bacterium]
MIKKLIVLIAACMLLCGIHAYAADGIEIYIDGERLEGGAAPVYTDYRVLVPMRAVFEAINVEVSWDGTQNKVTAQREDELVELIINNAYLSTGIFNYDGEVVWTDNIPLDVPARLIDDYTYVPVRAVSETLGASVEWIEETKTVMIDSRKNADSVIYYTSENESGKLCSIRESGLGRRVISSIGAHDIEVCDDGYVYYLSNDNNYLYRANNKYEEEPLLEKSINKIAIHDGFIYYQEIENNDEHRGVLYRMNISTLQAEQLTDRPVKWPKMYKGRIYFNIDYDNRMYVLTKDGASLNVIETGSSAFAKLYPFNCVFFDNYILYEDGVMYNDIMRVSLDGKEIKKLVNAGSVIYPGQTHGDKIVYTCHDNGQDIYCVNIDGTDNHLVHKGDISWLDIEIVARVGDTIYYKHPMRYEIYRVNLDGTDDRYVCYGEDIAISEDVLISAYQQKLYAFDTDGSLINIIYRRNVDKFKIEGNNVYFTDSISKRLYISESYGSAGAVTFDAVGEWVTDCGGI